MTANYVTLILDLADGSGSPVAKGTATLSPSVQLTDSADGMDVVAPVTASFRQGSYPQVRLLATDNTGPQPAGWAWTVSFSGVPGNPAPFSFFLPFSGGATQHLSALSPVSSAVTQFPANPMTAPGDMIYGGSAGVPQRLAGNTTTALEVLTSAGAGGAATAPAWQVLTATSVGADPARMTATGMVVNAASAAQIAYINANGLPGYATLPSAVLAGGASLAAMKGDNSTNDQPALKNLVTYLGAAYTATGQPWVIYCPAGIYSLRDNGTIWAPGVGLIGDGPGLTVFKLSNPVNTTNPTPLATYTAALNGASTSNPLARPVFRDFEIDGSGVSLASYNVGAKGLSLQYIQRGVFENLYIHDCGASGFGVDFLDPATIVQNVIALNNGRLAAATDIGASGLGIGVGGWANGGFNEGCDITNCVGIGNAKHGLFLELQNNAWPRPRGYSVTGGRFQGNRYGVSDWGCDGMITSGVQILSNLKNGFYVSAEGTGSTAGINGLVTGCVIDGNAIDGVNVGDSNRYQVAGNNRISNNGRHGYHANNVVNAQSVGMATLVCRDNAIWGNGYCGIRTDALLNNPYLQVNAVFNNGVQAAGASSNSGGTVTYGALTVTDTAAAWTVSSQIGKTVTVGAQTAIVQSNTATVLTLWPAAPNGSTAWTSGTPAAGTGYSLPAAPSDRAGINFNNTVNHPMISGNRSFDDNGPRIQPYGIYITATGTCTNGWVTGNDFLGNLTASFNFVTAPSGGVWDANNGMSAGNVSSPGIALTDGPMSYTGFVQPGNGSALGSHIYSGSGTPTISGTSGDFYFRDDTPGTNLQRLYVCSGGATWTPIL